MNSMANNMHHHNHHHHMIAWQPSHNYCSIINMKLLFLIFYFVNSKIVIKLCGPENVSNTQCWCIYSLYVFFFCLDSCSIIICYLYNYIQIVIIIEWFIISESNLSNLDVVKLNFLFSPNISMLNGQKIIIKLFFLSTCYKTRKNEQIQICFTCHGQKKICSSWIFFCHLDIL